MFCFSFLPFWNSARLERNLALHTNNTRPVSKRLQNVTVLVCESVFFVFFFANFALPTIIATQPGCTTRRVEKWSKMDWPHHHTREAGTILESVACRRAQTMEMVAHTRTGNLIKRFVFLAFIYLFFVAVVFCQRRPAICHLPFGHHFPSFAASFGAIF